MMKQLEGKVAVVIGGNSGIGWQRQSVFQQEGARVAISGRSKKALDEAASYITGVEINVDGGLGQI